MMGLVESACYPSFHHGGVLIDLAHIPLGILCDWNDSSSGLCIHYVKETAKNKSVDCKASIEFMIFSIEISNMVDLLSISIRLTLFFYTTLSLLYAWSLGVVWVCRY